MKHRDVEIAIETGLKMLRVVMKGRGITSISEVF